MRLFFRRDRNKTAVDEPVAQRESLSRSARTLAQVSQELTSWVPILRRLAEAEALRELALGHSSEITGPAVRSIIAARRLRDEYFWPQMDETVWTLLLELFANRLEGQRLNPVGLSEATAIPPANCQHWIDWLHGRGMIFRNARVEDEATALVDLTDAGADEMRAYLMASLRLSPWVQ